MIVSQLTTSSASIHSIIQFISVLTRCYVILNWYAQLTPCERSPLEETMYIHLNSSSAHPTQMEYLKHTSLRYVSGTKS